jgi:hypothetical protein
LNSPLDYWQAMGIWGLAVLVAGGASLASALVVAIPVAAKWRPPAFLWVVGPAGIVGAGAIGTWVAGTQVMDAIQHVDFGSLAPLLAEAYGECVISVAFSLVVAGLVLGTSAGMLGLAGVIGAGKDAILRPGGAAGAAALGLLGGLVSIGVAVGLGGLGIGVTIGVTAIVGGFGIALASLRLPEEPEDAERPAATRPAAAMLAILGVLSVGIGCFLVEHATATAALAELEATTRVARSTSALAGAFACELAVVPALLGVVIGSAGPILGVGTLLPGLRSAIGGIGTALVLVVPVGAAALSLYSLEVMRPLMGRESLRDAVAAIALPDPKSLGARPRDNCIAVDDAATGWSTQPLGPRACDPLEDVLVAIAGDRPGNRLLSAPLSSGSTFDLVARPKGASPTGPNAGMDLESIPFTVPTGDKPVFVIFDDPTGEKMYDPAGTMSVMPGDPDGWRLMIASTRTANPAAVFVLVPRDTWTVQDVVARCALIADDPDAPCAIALFVPSAEEVSVDATDSAPPAVKAVIAQYSGRLKYCYDHSLKTNPDLNGRIKIRFVVHNGSTTESSLLSNSTGDRPLAECVVGMAKEWKFPVNLDGEYTYPFSFHAVE